MLSDSVFRVTDRKAAEKAAIERVLAAWAALSLGRPAEEVSVLKAPRHNGKSVVFSLGHVGPQRQGVVAKELLADAASVELSVYSDILPRLAIRGPDLIGWTNSIDPGRVWLFLEELDGPPYDKRDADHVGIASSWLGAFHAGTADGQFDRLLPDRGPEYYTSLVEHTLDDMDEVAGNPVLDESDVEVLRQVSKLLSRFLTCSASFGDVYSALPAGVVHGDFKGNNMAFSSRIGFEELRVFDWSEAHRGPLAIDTWWVEPSVYRVSLGSAGLVVRSEVIDTWRHFSAVIRWVLALSWETPRLRYEWVERPMRRMSLYESRLQSALDGSPWVH